MEYVCNVSIVWGLIKASIFSQEIFHKEHIPAGSHEENYALIHPDQKGFVAGRYIGEAIRTTYDIIEHAKEKKIDFEKAYDSVSFNFIIKCLKFLNFSNDLIRWVSILLNNFKGVVNHCGNISERFAIGRGCRQGDPIASYLFIICIEILAHKLRADTFVEGLKLSDDDNDDEGSAY